MDWLKSLRRAIDYMEEHLLQDIGAKEVAEEVHISPFYFQRCFKIVTGYTIGEYLRNRRLYLAGLEVLGRNGLGERHSGGDSGSPGERLNGGGSGGSGERLNGGGSGGPGERLSVSGAGSPGEGLSVRDSGGNPGGAGKVIDLAYKYGYDTPESFTRAFTRFHGLSPMQLRARPYQLKVFLPLIVEIS